MSDSRPELPYIGAAVVAYVGYTRKHKQFPPNGLTRFMALIAVIIFVSGMSDTKLAPVFNSLGVLTLIATIIAVNAPDKGKQNG